jgi:hypothetical protein
VVVGEGDGRRRTVWLFKREGGRERDCLGLELGREDGFFGSLLLGPCILGLAVGQASYQFVLPCSGEEALEEWSDIAQRCGNRR